MRSSLLLWYAVAQRSFRRYSTYRIATISGVFTNVVFGVITSYAFIALWQQQPRLGGYDVVDAVTFTWIGQALIMPVAVWGGGFQVDFTERIRSGDIAIDLYRPTPLVSWWLAADLGRACFHFVVRGVPMIAAGALLFDLHYPSSAVRWVAFAVSAWLAVVASFGVRFLVSLSAFWLLDSRGTEGIATVLGMFCSGLILPLVVFPGWLSVLLLHMPWAAFVQTPADVWLGKTGGAWATVGTLAFQALWVVALLALAQALLRLAYRVVVVQGG